MTQFQLAGLLYLSYGIEMLDLVLTWKSIDAIPWTSVQITREETIRILTSISSISMKGADVRKETKCGVSTSFSNSSISFKCLSSENLHGLCIRQGIWKTDNQRSV